MKDTVYRRIARRRVEAALRLQVRKPALAPRVAPLFEPIPPEVVDLSTGAHELHFRHGRD